MLAFQNLHQFVFNLSQVSSAISSTYARVTSTSSKKKPEVDVYCSESFLNTLKTIEQCDGTKPFKHLPKFKLGSKFEGIQCIYFNDINFKFSVDKSVNNSDLYILLDESAFKSTIGNSLNFSTLDSSCGKKQKKIIENLENFIVGKSWNSNYVSGKSFNENKESSCCTGYSKNNKFNKSSSVFSSSLGSFHALNNSLNVNRMQIRGFKTKRVIEFEEKMNSGLFSRFGKVVGSLGSNNNNNVETKEKYLESPVMTRVMAGESLPEDKLKLQVSFSEGYRTAVKELKAPNKSKFSKFFNLLSTGFMIVLLLSAIGIFSGELVKIRINFRRPGEIDPENITVKFTDVKGVEEVKDELKEIVDFLKNPSKFSAMGGKLPKGVLLVGPPGTGKTLLARALAGEAQVPFFHASGSEFDEIFVGEGARRMRNLFQSAKAKAPSIIFIDEIDCVGSKRKSTMLHPYANQTINQLLSEMDGFSKNEGVIIVGATNRKEDLDSALLRPGRFDVEVLVPLPDMDGRRQILELYLSKVVSKDIDLNKIAKATAGCTGADLEAMVNHAAIRAAADGATHVSMEYLENAKDKIMIGPERKSAMKNDDDNLMTAIHEGGHTVVAYFTEGVGVVDKVSIVPRGQTLGHTAVVPEGDDSHITKAKCLAKMDILLGGRAAEELVFGTNKITANASDDLDKATGIASRMIKQFGMSDKIGLRTLNNSEGELIAVNQYGQVVTDQVDLEVKKLIQDSYERAKAILKKHAKEHKLLAEALVKYKTLSPEDVRAILGDNASEKSSISSASASN